MSLDSDLLEDSEIVIERDLNKDILDGDRLFLIARRIFLVPQVKHTDYGFVVSGTPIDCMLPYFNIEVYKDEKKIRAVIRSEAILSKYWDEIDKILLENF